MVTLAVLEILAAAAWTGDVHSHAIPEYGPGPIPLSSEAAPEGTGQCSGGQSGRKGSRGLNVLLPHGQGRCSGPSAVSKPAAQPGILALTPLDVAPLFPPTPPPCQPKQEALMDHLHYLPHHCLNIYQTIMYLVARSREWKGQEAERLWPEARVTYRLDKSPRFKN